MINEILRIKSSYGKENNKEKLKSRYKNMQINSLDDEYEIRTMVDIFIYSFSLSLASFIFREVFKIQCTRIYKH